MAPLRARLDEMRASTCQSRIQAELDLGHHLSVIPELVVLITDNPLREGFHAQLIVALYRSGRQSDALAAYRDLHHLLDTELGIEPSPSLRELNNRVLMQDPALAWRPPATARLDPVAAHAPVAPLTAGGSTGNRRRRLGAVAVVVAVLALAAGATIREPAAPGTSTAMLANAVSELDESGTLMRSIPVGINPIAATSSHGAIWVINAGDDAVAKVDPATRSIRQEIDVGRDPRALAVTGDDLWVTNFASGNVSRINVLAARVVDTIRVGNGPDAIAAGPAGLWVANSGDNTIQRIDPTSGDTGPQVDVGDGPDGLTVDETSVWVANGRGATVMRVDGRTRELMSAPIPVGSGPRGIVRVGDDVWVANELSQSLTRINVATGNTHTVTVGDGPSALAVLGRSVWVTEKYSGDLWRIDSRTESKDTYDLDAAVHGLTVAGGHLWVTSGAFASTSHRGGALRVAAGLLPGHFSGIDPARVYDRTAWHAERAVYDGLLAYHYSSADPQVLVPDLATAVPQPTDGGRTYTFNLRPGIRYSTGADVRATDFVRGVRRALLATDGRPDFYARIVGGQACIDDPASCDLRKGVIADDTTGRVTFHLATPDPSFLYKLTLLLVPTPPGTPIHLHGSPLPGTGPYQISSYKFDRRFVLTRNPYFHEWSAAAQPAGFPDRITWLKVNDARAAAHAVRRGRADLAELTPLGEAGPAVGSLVESLRVAMPTRTHSTTMQATAFIVLNSSIPPFNDVRARRALDYAIDRTRAVAIMGGRAVAAPTCQLLPPSMPAYRPYCPYSRGASEEDHTGDYQGPDLDRARKLVAASGTQGTTITVTDVVGDYNPPFEEYVTKVLRALGYHAELRQLPFTKRNLNLLSSLDSVQIESGGWIADFPTPANFYDLVSCDFFSGYPIGYCNRRMDQRAKAAARPGAPIRSWTDIDREITNQAPLVPVTNDVNWWLTSDRIGNYQGSAQGAGPLLSQLWIH